MKQAFEAANDNIQLLADRFEIGNLLMDIAIAIDNKNFDALKDIFELDAFIDCTACIGAKGKYPDHKHLLEDMPRHVVSQADICIDGDTASGMTLCHTLQEPAGKVAGEVCYADKFLRTDKGWRITERVQQRVCSSV